MVPLHVGNPLNVAHSPEVFCPVNLYHNKTGIGHSSEGLQFSTYVLHVNKEG